MPQKLSASKIARLVIPPLVTLSASAFILIEASWLHNKYHHTAKQTLTTATGPASNDTPSTPAHLQHATTAHASKPQRSVQSNDHTGTSASQPNQTTPASTNGDVGFTPVSGGSLKASAKPEYLNLSSALSSLVTQYGTAPVTSFDSETISSQYGVKVQLNLPSTVSVHQILLLPLGSGVLWAIVPPTGVDASGSIAGSTAPSQLFYTPYGGPDPSKVILSMDAESLGALPVSVGGSDLTASWYLSAGPSSANAPSGTSTGALSVISPPSGESGTPTGNLTQNSTGNAAATTATAVPAGGSVQVRTVADDHTDLFWRGLYKVDGGAVIVVRAQGQSGVSQWAFLWNEANRTLKPICSVTNSSSQFGWIAVGQHTVYWAQRHLIAPANIHYQGSQYMMSLATGRVRSIKLGSWSAEAVAGQDINSYHSDPDPRDDELYFRIQNSPVWKEFVPSP